LVVNLPFTYPARPLNGALISGFVAPLFDRAVYPESLIPWLKARNYRIDVDAAKGRSDRRSLIADLFEILSLHTEVMSALLESQPWDLFIGVITGTDRLQHFFFDAAYDTGHPYHKDFMQYYSRIDSFLGAFLQQLGPDTRLIVLSDHGFTRLKTQVYLNHWLRMMGYLSYGRPDPQGLEDISRNSTAFAMDPNRIYLNSRDRFPNGAISEAEKHGVRSRLKSELGQIRLRDLGIEDASGEDSPDDTLFVDILVKEDVYHGECLSMAPDLLLVPRPGYDLKATINVHTACRKDIFTGTHTHDDAFLVVDDASVQGRLSQPRITDVAGLVREIFT
jgi:predicted AlkP superfamily phosphohydrolase/phosphomutase